MRRSLPWLALALLLPVSWLVLRDVQLQLFDFVEYWAAGNLCVRGENPYDAKEIEKLEKQLGREEDHVLMWNPPWTLPIVMPFGLLEPRVAHLLWLGIQFAAVAFSAD